MLGTPVTLTECAVKALAQFVVSVSSRTTINKQFIDAVHCHVVSLIPQHTWVWEKWIACLFSEIENYEDRPVSICRLALLAFGNQMLGLDVDPVSALRILPDMLYEGIRMSPNIVSFRSTREAVWTCDPAHLDSIGEALGLLQNLRSLTLRSIVSDMELHHFTRFVSCIASNCRHLQELDLSQTPFCDECAVHLATNCPSLEILKLTDTELTEAGVSTILCSMRNLRIFEAFDEHGVSLASSTLWQLIWSGGRVATKLECIELGFGIEPVTSTSAVTLQVMENVRKIIFRNAANPRDFQFARSFPALETADIVFDEVWDLSLITILPLLEIALLTGFTYPVTFSFKSVGLLDVLVLERLGQFFPRLVELTLTKPEPNYGEPFVRLMNLNYFQNLEVLHYEGCLYPPHAVILLSRCTRLRKLTLFTDILPVSTVRTILQSNPMERLEELRLGLQKDLSVDVIRLFVDAAPKLRVLGRIFWWNAIPKEQVQQFLREIKGTRFLVILK